MQSLCPMRVPGIAPRQATSVPRPSCPTLSPAASHAPFGISSNAHARRQRSVASGSTSTLVRAETNEQQHQAAASSPPAVAVATTPHAAPAVTPVAPPAPKEKEHWWEKDLAPNMRDAHSVQELVDLLADAGDRLVIVEFYARWCAACRALFPKICRLMGDNPELLFIKVDFDVNKPMARTLGIKVLPFFHFYKGGEGRVEAFSCTITKLQRFKDAVEKHSGAFCSLQPLTGLAEFPDVVPHAPLAVSDGEGNNNSRPDTPTRVA